MISEHFPQAQFILISLKEGMWSHANVLFKTSFVDGVSKVDRIQLKSSDYQKKKSKSTENMMITSK
mgnify:CR=1 FL=1